MIKNDENQLNLTTIDTDKKWHHYAISIDFDNQNARFLLMGNYMEIQNLQEIIESVDFLLIGDYSAQTTS